jgi:hypothetical protein
MDVKGQRVLTPPRRRRVGARRGRAGELAGPSFSRRRSRSPTHLFRLKPAPMSSHGHSHDHGRGHSHAEPSHSHSHDGVECAGHDATLPTEAELAAQKQERLAFDRVVASFYNYEPHSVRSLAMASLGSRQSLRPSAFHRTALSKSPPAEGPPVCVCQTGRGRCASTSCIGQGRRALQG